MAATDQSFAFRVVTPAGVALEEQVQEVYLPAESGEVGVLPGHALYTGLLGVGILRYKKDGSEKSLVVAGGFSSYTDGCLTILADSADFADSIDLDSYSEERSALKEKVSGTSTFEPEWAFASKELARIEAIDKLISH